MLRLPTQVLQLPGQLLLGLHASRRSRINPLRVQLHTSWRSCSSEAPRAAQSSHDCLQIPAGALDCFR